MAALQSPQRRTFKAKVCVVGEFAVGKTSLVNRYVHNVFNDRYFATIGAKITKAELDPSAEDDWHLVMTIWDIMGERGFRELLKEAYFDGVHGALAVCDLTRPETLSEVDGWISAVHRIAGRVPVVLLGNKADMEEQLQVHRDGLGLWAEERGLPHVLTSAKTGENVQMAFKTLAGLMVEGRGT